MPQTRGRLPPVGRSPYPAEMAIGDAPSGFREGGGPHWRELERPYSWDDLVLPAAERERLQSIVGRIRITRRRFSPDLAHPARWHERSPAALFVGPEGTGKTMAAQVLGAEVDLPVLEVSLESLLAQQMPDEKRRAIVRVFALAEGAGAILVLDRLETLLTSEASLHVGGSTGTDPSQTRRALDHARSDPEGGVDPIVTELLSQSARYPGAVIWASRTARGIGPTLAARFEPIVRFPAPDRYRRKEIWRRALPSDACLTDSTLDYLAAWLRWPGSMIRRCCDEAAAEARREGVPLQLRHVAQVRERGFRTQIFTEPESEALSAERLQEKARAAQLRTGVRERGGVRRLLGRAGVISVLAGAVIAAVLGWMVARETSHGASVDRAVTSAGNGVLEISYPSNWRREPPPATPGLRLTDTLRLAAGGGSLLVGRTTGYEAPLPSAVVAALAADTVPQIVRVGTLSLYRYTAGAHPGSTSVSIYAAPATVGAIVGICRVDRGSVEFLSNCGRAMGTIRLRSGTFLPVGPNPTYAQTLTAVIAKLNAARAADGAQSARATNPQSAASADRALAAAYAEAASALRRVTTGPADVVNAALANALQMTATAYNALAVALAGNDQRAYNAGRGSLARATAAVRAAFAQLSELGYRMA